MKCTRYLGGGELHHLQPVAFAKTHILESSRRIAQYDFAHVDWELLLLSTWADTLLGPISKPRAGLGRSLDRAASRLNG